MMQKELKKKIPLALLMALIIGISVSLMVAMVAAAMIAGEKVQEDASGWIAMLSVFFGSLTTALVTMGKVKQMRFAMCLSAGGVYMLGLCCMGAVMFDGVKSGLWATGALALGGALTAFLLGMERKGKPKFKIPKQRF